MPTTYAHDLFGKEVYKRLPSDMKALIRRHGDLYRIGLHGPDILFYYMVSKNPVTQFGIEMHHEKARAFFEEGMRQVRRNDDEALFAYLLGFGCHYILDSACHPYVNKMAAEGVNLTLFWRRNLTVCLWKRQVKILTIIIRPAGSCRRWNMPE